MISDKENKMSMRGLLRRIKEEEARGNVSSIEDLSESLREELKSRVVSGIFDKGLKRVKSFLEDF